MSGRVSPQESSPRDDAIRLLARREYARAELERRLGAKGHALDDIERALDALAAEGLQSDERFAEIFVRSRIARGQGPIKIRAELGERGIAAEQARQAFDEAQAREAVDWCALACETLAKRFTGPGEGPRERARRERFLAGRGFDFDQVRHALAHAWDHA
ncbi:recombination regulator RecX [Halomonas sp. McH1-25]|uniref:regulatory protein RecX n=1 Tax=unclassified Halomonas TaxID=2609666 RepID=UPI001EF5D3A5|nr:MULTISPECIES: regulatory protein RecX [unclassified Halomonas]MCG7601444.1 recombination regulator RecX [Halomonas sp. McH1-25]MCP1341985.1 recombination regulator RecX [Halomonas sp. FL8]MCP1363131.1 recombination regulator RecX [Halomonas sp. BBD45]MCP1365722.1 recombination regulator RecX [Halomonas sp. BBD48]